MPDDEHSAADRPTEETPPPQQGARIVWFCNARELDFGPHDPGKVLNDVRVKLQNDLKMAVRGQGARIIMSGMRVTMVIEAPIEKVPLVEVPGD